MLADFFSSISFHKSNAPVIVFSQREGGYPWGMRQFKKIWGLIRTFGYVVMMVPSMSATYQVAPAPMPGSPIQLLTLALCCLSSQL